MTLKPISALLIVALGQINFLIHNHHSSSQKLKEFYQKSGRFKESKDAKKLVSTSLGKQLSARIKNIKQPNLQRILRFANHQKDQIFLLEKINLKSSFEKFLTFNFLNIDFVCFGCCGDRH